MCRCWKVSAGGKAGDLRCWQLQELMGVTSSVPCCHVLPEAELSVAGSAAWGPQCRTPGHALPSSAAASPARRGRGLSHLCLQCPATDAHEGGQGTCDGHVGPGTFIPEGKPCLRPEVPALPDWGHFPEKRGQPETWVWMCGAHSSPVVGLSLPLHHVGAVWVE